MPDDGVPQPAQEPLRVQLLSDKPAPKSRWEHPLTIALFSFLLTGLIGAGISYLIQRTNADIDRNAKQYEASTTAIAALSDSLYARYVRAGLLDSALERGATIQEVTERKKLYDEAVVSQESKVFGQELLIREALQEYQYSSFETLYDSRLTPPLVRLDSLLRVATDQYIKDKKAVLPIGEIGNAYDDTRHCEYALINLVFLEVSSKAYQGKSGHTITSREEALQDFDAQCPEPPPENAPANP